MWKLTDQLMGHKHPSVHTVSIAVAPRFHQDGLN